MQIGFKQALIGSTSRVPAAMSGEVVIVSPYYQMLDRAPWIYQRLLTEARAEPLVVSVAPLFVANLPIRDINDGTVRLIAAYGFDPARPALELPGLASQLAVLAVPRRALFDRHSRPLYGPIAQTISERGILRLGLALPGMTLQPEVELVGTIALGPGLANDGALIMSAFTLSQFTGTPLDRPNFGVVRLARGADPQQVARSLQRRLGGEARVLTRTEFIAAEQNAWLTLTPIGAVLTIGVIVGGAIGLAFVYQILQMNIRNNLASYAVLKSMGYPGTFFFVLVTEIALIVGLISFVPALPVVWLLYRGTASATGLEMSLQPETVLSVFAVVLLISMLSAVLALRKLRAADPVSLF